MPEMRQNPVTRRWVIIATERAKRPEQARIEKLYESLPEHDEQCFFCWGNEETTPPEVYSIRLDDSLPDTPGWLLRVVNNKYAAVNLNQPFIINNNDCLEVFSYAKGIAEVIIETNNHSLNPSTMSLSQNIRVLKAYQDRYNAISKVPEIQYISIFRNNGALAGASLEHPHSQIIAVPLVPPVITEELEGSKAYYKKHNRCVWCDEIEKELNKQQRIIFKNSYFVAFVPYAARSPFELVIMPRFHSARFEEMEIFQLTSLAEVWKAVFYKLSESLSNPPYNCFIHTAPLNVACDEHFHWHIEILPKLTISAGFELCTGMFINVTIPEDCADFLNEIEVVF